MIEYKKYFNLLLFLLPILLIAFLVRVYNLTELPVFADEAIYIRWAQVMRAESTLRFLPLSDGKQPLFMWVVIPFLKLFSDPLFAGRLVSILTGIGTMTGAAFVSFETFKSKKTALLTAALIVASPYFFFFDRIALVDSMLTMFGMWSFYLILLTVKHLRLDTAILSGFALGGAWLTKSPAIFFLLMSPGVFLLSKAFDKKHKEDRRTKVLMKFLGLLAVSFVVAFGMYNILRLGPNFHMIALRNRDYVSPISHIWTSPLDPFKPYIHRIFEWITNLGPWPIWLMALTAIAMGYKKHHRQLLVLGIWFLFPLLVNSVYAKAFTSRYILFTIPYLFILSGSFVLTKFKYKKYLTSVLLVLFFGLSFYKNYYIATDPEKANLPQVMRTGYLEEWTSGTGIKEAAEYVINRHLETGEEIIVGTEGYFGTLPDGLQIYTNNYPEIKVFGIGLDLTQIPQQLVDTSKDNKQTYLVANSSRIDKSFWEKEGGKFEIVLQAPKALREEGTLEYVKHGERDYFYLLRVI